LPNRPCLALSLARRADARLELVRAHLCYADKKPSCAWLPYEPDEDARQRQEEQLYLQGTADLPARIQTTTGC
jgi:hypothetical protein